MQFKDYPSASAYCRRRRWILFLVLACLALAVRLPRLGERPMHSDEAVNAVITGQLLSGEVYRYDGRDRHGPALCALAMPVARAFGARNLAGLDEVTLRLVPALTGALAVLLFATIAHETGMLAAIIAALLWAFAPLPLYYSRYFIHETLFVAATLGFLSYGWRALDLGSIAYGIVAGACAGIMLACKETALISFAAAGLAGFYWMLHARRIRAGAWQRQPVSWGSVAVALSAVGATGLLFVLIIYTWGFRRWQGPMDLFQSVPGFLRRATGEGHEKPVWYYFQLLSRGLSGVPVLLLALIGAVSISQKASQPARLDAGSVHGPNASITLRMFLLYTLAVCGCYSLIPYKTPWLGLNLWLPISVLAGCGCTALWNGAKLKGFRWALSAGALALAAALANDVRTRVFFKSSDEENPYAYAHTVEDMLRLPEWMEKIARQVPACRDLRIAVIAKDPWPLPWYLRRYPNTGYWQPDQNPGAADVYLTSPEAVERFPRVMENRRPEYFGIRPGVLMILWTKEEPRQE
jgi:uncharacterized protein (TIGR03663 family)